MANPEHLDILRQGVEVWNQWREENQEIEDDLLRDFLNQVDLSFVNFNGANLTKVNLTKVNLGDTNFSKANLSDANLSRAFLSNANLSDANLSDVDLSNTYLSDVDLSNANLSRAFLSNANLSDANLTNANLTNAKLIGARLIEANLTNANLSDADLSDANLTNAKLIGARLIEANLTNANLSDADLSKADLSGIDFSGIDFSGIDLNGVNLSRTDLSKVQMLGTNLEKTTLTGACIKDWHINTETNLKNIKCDYIFFNLIRNEQEKQIIFTERRPHQEDKNFEPGDFERLVRKSQETIDLIFRNGIDWQAFLNSYEQLKVEAGEDLFPVQSIENQDDGSFIVKLKSPIGTDKEATEKFFEEKYQKILQEKEQQYLRDIEYKDKEVSIYREQLQETRYENSQLLLGMFKTMAEQQGSPKYQFNNPQIENWAEENKGLQMGGGIHNYAPEQKQSLAEAATEIQQLLDQLSETYSPEEAEQMVAKDLANKAKQDPSFKEKLKNWSLSLANKGAEVGISEIAKEGVKRVIPLAIALLV